MIRRTLRHYKLFLAGALVGCMALVSVATVNAAPVDVLQESCATKTTGVCKDRAGTTVMGIIKNVISLLITVGGIVAVIMIVVGGITYSTSAGDSNQTKRGKDTVIYAVVGLVVAIMAYAIVNFVLGKIG